MSKRNDPKGRTRKAEVWAGIPRRDRRALQTAGRRDLVRQDAREFCNLKRLGGKPAGITPERVSRGLAKARTFAERYTAQDGFHAAIDAPTVHELDRDTLRDPNNSKRPPAIDPLREKRSEAARRGAATRAAKREAEARAIKDAAIENKRATRKATTPRHHK